MSEPKNKLVEKFAWMAAPEFQIVDTGKNTVTIKGVAVKKGQVSRNKRRYVDEELHSAARTWIGKPVTINHSPWSKTHPMYDGRKVAGNVEWMEYEDGQMEYRARINKQPYVDLLRSRSVEVKGVSIEADYLYNLCSHCGMRFYDEESFKQHMISEHFIRNFSYEPHGCLGRALSIVLSPEEPGVPDTSIELMESYGERRGLSSLLETVMNSEKEKAKYMKAIKGKAAITPQKRITMHTPKKLKEQDEEPTTHECPEGEHWSEDEGKCVPKEQAAEQEITPEPAEHECPEGQQWSDTEHKCVDITPDVEEPVVAEQDEGTVISPEPIENAGEPPTLEPKCADGFHREGENCVPDEPVAEEPQLPVAPMPTIPATQPPSPAPVVEPSVTTEQEDMGAEGVLTCDPGSHYDKAAGTCVPDDLPVEPTPEPVQVTEYKLPPLLKLNEPCSLELRRCVDKLIAQGRPESSAWAICKDQLGETKAEKTLNIYEAQDDLKRELREFMIDTQTTNNQFANAINAINETVAKTVNNQQRFSKRCEALSKRISGESKLRHAYDRTQAKQLFQELGKYRSEERKLLENANTQTMGYLNKKLSQLATESLKLNKQLASNTWKQRAEISTLTRKHDEAIAKLTAENQRLSEKMDEKTAIFEKTLALADKNNVDLREHLKTLEQRVQEQEDAAAEEPEPCPEGEHRDEDGKCVPNEPTPEAEETKKRLEEMTTRLENLEAKQRGTFQGKAPTITEAIVKEHPEDPNQPLTKKQRR